jgi:hypothetical protein
VELSPKLQKQLARLCASGDTTAMLEVTCAITAVLDERATIKKAGRKGRTAKTPRHAKRKGSEAVHRVREYLLDTFKSSFGLAQAGLPAWEPDDILIQTTSVGGNDLHLSPLAKRVFPFGIEVKNKESLNVYQALAQAQASATKKGLFPILFFQKNGWPLHVAIDARLFARYLRGERPRQGDCTTEAERPDQGSV